MKRTIALLLVLVTLLSLVACGSPSTIDNNQTQHTHSFGEWAITKNATCTGAGLKERTCSCGEKETQSIAALGHSTRQGICETCGQFINELAAEVNELSEFVSDISLATELIDKVYLASILTADTYKAAKNTYFGTVDPCLKEISDILSKYPNDFLEFRSIFHMVMLGIDDAMHDWDSRDGFSYSNCKILQEASEQFIFWRPSLNSALGSYKQ